MVGFIRLLWREAERSRRHNGIEFSRRRVGEAIPIMRQLGWQNEPQKPQR